jgi:hypothetical protein
MAYPDDIDRVNVVALIILKRSKILLERRKTGPWTQAGL